MVENEVIDKEKEAEISLQKILFDTLEDKRSDGKRQTRVTMFALAIIVLLIFALLGQNVYLNEKIEKQNIHLTNKIAEQQNEFMAFIGETEFEVIEYSQDNASMNNINTGEQGDVLGGSEGKNKETETKE